MKKYQNKRKLGKHINCFISQNAKEVLECYLKSKKLNITECIENLILELDPNKENLKARDFYESLFKVISINQHVYRELMANSNNLNQLTKNTNIAIKYNKLFYLQNISFLEQLFKLIEDIMNIESDEVIVIVTGAKATPLKLKANYWFKDKELLKRANLPIDLEVV
ncbi:hypothetical protein HpCHN52_07970 [Helicobacter pylori]